MSRRKLGRTSIPISDLRVLACGVALKQYPRDDTLWEGLTRVGFAKLIDLRRVQDYLDVYQKSINKKDASRTKNRSRFRRIARQIYLRHFTYILSILQTARKEKVDVIFIFPRNHYLAIYLWLLKPFCRVRVYFDLWNSGYSIAVSNSFGKIWTYLIGFQELLSIKLVNHLFTFTKEYTDYFQRTYKFASSKCSVVPLGVQSEWFEKPLNVEDYSSDKSYLGTKRVLYWGTFLIQHGLDVVINAAEELKDEKVKFIFCGGGKKEAWIREEVRKRKLNNVVFKGFIPTTKELIHLVDSADVCLGFFRDTHDSSLMTPNKVLQGMARGKPVITLWSKQQEDMYQTKDNPFPPLILINPDSKSLAKAIMVVVEDPEKAGKIGDAARSTVKRLHGVEAVTSALRKGFEKSI
jgi:glycosyltransferase involved in cell wall biosynthesis